jgi:DNA replicative helicase MCM subunit Mcm2 (Cdc46/Mcm family)
MDPISTASSGLLAAGARFNVASRAIVTAAASGGDAGLTSAVVSQAVDGDQLKASASVLKTSDRMFKVLLDITT